MKARVRTKGTSTPQTYCNLHLTPPNSEPVLYHVSFPDIEPEKFEYFADVVGNMQSEFNPCDHYKLLNNFKPIEYVVNDPPEGNYYYSFTLGGIVPEGVRETLVHYPFLSSQYLDDFAASAQDHFETVVDDDSSLINLIIELIEMCELNLKAIKNFAEKFLKAYKTFMRILQETGSIWVAWNFAIKPLIRDIRNLMTMASRARKRLKWLKKHNHLPTKVRYQFPKEEITIENFSFGPTSWWTAAPGYDEIPDAPPFANDFQADVVGEAKVRAWAYVKFDVPDYILDDMILAMGMIMMTMQGIYNPAKIIWEAIPFSWLIEWFTSKRTQLLKELASLDPFGRAEILKVGYSIKYKLMGDLVWETDSINGDIGIGSFLFDRYVRREGLPTGESSIWSGSLDLRQAGILGGIAVNWRQRR